MRSSKTPRSLCAITLLIAAGWLGGLVGCNGDTGAGAAVSHAPGTGAVHGCPIQTLDGRSTTVGAFYEGKPMIIEMWSTTCAPCKVQRKIFTKLGSQLTDHVTLIGISIDQTPEIAGNYLAKNKTPGMVELYATPEFRALVKPHLKKPVMTIPQILYVNSNGDVMDVADSVQSEVWLTARAQSLQ